MLKEKIASLILMLMVVPTLVYASQDLQDKAQQDIVAGDAAATKADIDALYRDLSYVGSTDVKYVHEYEGAQAFLSDLDDLNALTTKLDPSNISEDDRNTVIQTFNSLQNVFNSLASAPLHFSNPGVVESLNTRMKGATASYNAFIDKMNVAAAAKQKAQEQAEEQQRITQEQQDEAAHQKMVAEQKKEQLAEQSAARKHKLKIADLDQLAKSKGYKGLYSSGVAQFIYTKQHKGGIEKDVNYVFWSGISENDKRHDSEFTLENIVDGYGIYTLANCCDPQGRMVTMTIAVPVDKSAINGQSLTADYYVYVGNQPFTTVTGTQSNLPVFKPVVLDK